ncbi:hypothetical protein [Sphingomonas phyllosphaerae]|uniref:hypothetical protein n=1 Tax=Sphingomonas phyllosphaerae TaxID=257003 RepID=UPI0012DCCCC8|nr:hypothetical protein [Sphingomonas phyllosphaerae]
MMMMSAAVRDAARSIEREKPSAIVPPPAQAGRNSDRAECGIANVNLMTPGPARRRAGGGTGAASRDLRATFPVIATRSIASSPLQPGRFYDSNTLTTREH